MATCQSCGSQLGIAVRFCSACGAPAGSDDAATLASDNTPTLDLRSPTPGPRPSSASSSRPPSAAAFSISEGRFLPGRLIAGRYRIIALLGKGGMGEVYRADDLTLGQPVALKFLPEEATRDESVLERFRNEVRISRRVSHPNVCRVYDVGEVDGHTFFTMEYVDGEDLASLLRRIGRLPQDKALDITRQLCAGLAAAHAKGVLHRDLKPANIMLDGRGQVVMTDFGLAGLTDQIHGPDVRSGTPAYMAPEQLAGKEVSAQSDIYSLGLVLYEIFTGKRAFTPEALKELVRTGSQSAVSRPSSVVKDLDPAVERVILRCLEPEPRSRPASALSVAAALPGGDPLAAALAAGETPSPQMVAAAGETAGLSRRVAIACLAAILVGLAAAYYLTVRHSALDQIGAEQAPEALAQKARDTLATLGYEGRPADSFYDFDYDMNFVRYIEKHDQPRPNWDEILKARPSLLQFDYRLSPWPLLANDFHDMMLTPGMVNMEDPAPILSGMVRLQLDQEGRLVAFEAIPPEKADAPAPTPQAFDWKVLFAAAGLDISQYQSTQPLWNSLASPDTRAAWTGRWPGTDRALRVEAASFQGKPVYFYLIGEWTKPPRMPQEDSGKRAGQMILLGLLIMMLAGAVFLARRNYRQGRGDRDGAFRLAILVFAVLMVLWMLRSHLVAGLATLGLMILAISTALFLSGLIFVLYLALEPYVRRYWPHALISWSRLLSGRLRDPLVGRDILFGVLLGVIWISVFKASYFATMRMGAVPPLFSTDYLVSTRQALGMWLSQVPNAILGTLQFFFLLMGLKIVFKRDWICVVVFVAIFTVAKTVGAQYPVVEGVTSFVVYAIAALIVYRFGLVPLACAIFTVDLLVNVPFTADFSTWYLGSTMFALLSVVALAVWGFYTSLGGEPLWKVDV
jgi:predicted Ser/Thr protein kinase